MLPFCDHEGNTIMRVVVKFIRLLPLLPKKVLYSLRNSHRYYRDSIKEFIEYSIFYGNNGNKVV